MCNPGIKTCCIGLDSNVERIATCSGSSATDTSSSDPVSAAELQDHTRVSFEEQTQLNPRAVEHSDDEDDTSGVATQVVYHRVAAGDKLKFEIDLYC